MIIPSAEPFFFPGSPGRTGAGCLLIHGFTGSPKEMRPLGESLAARGHAVLGIRLAGHATQPEDMLRVRWQDWLGNVEDGWNLLRGALGRQDTPAPIFVMGLSMGGILSLLFAAYYPVAGVVAMSTPYALKPDPRLPYVEYLGHLQRTVAKGPPDWRDLKAGADHIDYPRYPTRAIAQLRDLAAEMRLSLPLVRVPVLLIHSCEDTGGGSFDPESMQKIYASLGVADKRMLWVEDSGHVITRDQQREQVFGAAAAFVQRITQANK
ncbi:MAG TPA: alpha/beta fold hydrolase [Anaerolineales bacterium]